MASACGDTDAATGSAAASAHAPRSSAYRAGMARLAYTPATPGAAPPIAFTSSVATVAGVRSSTASAARSLAICRYA